MTITLPWPHRDLHPNARVHYMRLAKAKKAYRQECAWSAKAQGLAKIKAVTLHVAITFHPPDRRRRDLDGMLSSVKAAIDGLVDVVGVDDSDWSLTIRKGDPVKAGKVVVRI